MLHRWAVEHGIDPGRRLDVAEYDTAQAVLADMRARDSETPRRQFADTVRPLLEAHRRSTLPDPYGET